MEDEDLIERIIVMKLRVRYAKFLKGLQVPIINDICTLLKIRQEFYILKKQKIADLLKALGELKSESELMK